MKNISTGNSVEDTSLQVEMCHLIKKLKCWDKTGMSTGEKNHLFCSSRALHVIKKYFQHKERHKSAEHGPGILVRMLLH